VTATVAEPVTIIATAAESWLTEADAAVNSIRRFDRSRHARTTQGHRVAALTSPRSLRRGARVAVPLPR
jgi:hypothetical protein